MGRKLGLLLVGRSEKRAVDVKCPSELQWEPVGSGCSSVNMFEENIHSAEDRKYTEQLVCPDSITTVLFSLVNYLCVDKWGLSPQEGLLFRKCLSVLVGRGRAVSEFEKHCEIYFDSAARFCPCSHSLAHLCLGDSV